MAAIPVAFRVTWVFTERDRPAQTIKKARLTIGQRDYRTQATVFRSKAERERLFKRRQASLTDGRPLQARMLTK